MYEALGTIKRASEDAGGGYDLKMVIKSIHRIATEALTEAKEGM